MNSPLGQLTIVNNIDDIDFVSLFQDSIDNFDRGTLRWPEDIITYEQKFNYFRSKTVDLLNDPYSFAFKRTQDNIDIIFNAGTIRGSTFVYVLGLTAKKAGSKAWIFNQEFAEQQMEFLRQNGCNSLLSHAVKNSAAETFIIQIYSGIPGTEVLLHNESEHIRNTMIKFPLVNNI